MTRVCQIEGRRTATTAGTLKGLGRHRGEEEPSTHSIAFDVGSVMFPFPVYRPHMHPPQLSSSESVSRHS